MRYATDRTDVWTNRQNSKWNTPVWSSLMLAQLVATLVTKFLLNITFSMIWKQTITPNNSMTTDSEAVTHISASYNDTSSYNNLPLE